MPLPPMTIVTRDVPPRTAWALEQAGVHPLLARLRRRWQADEAHAVLEGL